ncbi:hypothetical protein [Pleomorphomonas oryzae]|uniref:hypothetical protein n=1 Tax=Pleomorphomonas oryzae TaxID=261934 RepID=UPI0003FF5B8D|nr:hypothetical protein [Pleomorphomonas oryzae]
MNIGSATQSNPISTALRPAASVETKPSEREPDGDRDDKAMNLQPAAAKPLPAAVGKGLGLLVDVSV